MAQLHDHQGAGGKEEARAAAGYHTAATKSTSSGFCLTDISICSSPSCNV
jgi:hypothetical protein